jgi:L-threonylcarbamoyladenylate synthase
MRTQILSAHKEKDILEAARLIKNGEVVAIPTETVYGLAADANNEDAVKRIFIAKNRPNSHPLIVHIDSYKKIDRWAQDIPAITNIIANYFWPGPLTLLLNKKHDVSPVVTGGNGTIAIRIPQSEVMNRILNILDTGLAAPSANLHKKISATTAVHVLKDLSGKIAAVLDGGSCQIGIESTILDLTSNQYRILRPGPITKEMLEEVLNAEICIPYGHDQKISGNMKEHYQPYTNAIMLEYNKMFDYVKLDKNKHKNIAIIHYSDVEIISHKIYLQKMPTNKYEYGKEIYYMLFKVDQMNFDEIVIEAPPHNIEWMDILDRLNKACYKEAIRY